MSLPCHPFEVYVLKGRRGEVCLPTTEAGLRLAASYELALSTPRAEPPSLIDNPEYTENAERKESKGVGQSLASRWQNQEMSLSHSGKSTILYEPVWPSGLALG